MCIKGVCFQSVFDKFGKIELNSLEMKIEIKLNWILILKLYFLKNIILIALANIS